METLLKSAWRDFYTPKGWVSSSSALLPGMPSVQVQEDGALPSASAKILSLSLLSQDDSLLERARGLVPASWLAVQDDPFWYATTVGALLFSANRQDTARSSP
jgi:hypothetical protein